MATPAHPFSFFFSSLSSTPLMATPAQSKRPHFSIFHYSPILVVLLLSYSVSTAVNVTAILSADLDAVNLTRDVTTGSVTARSPVPYSTSNATVLSQIKTLPYNITILAVDALRAPYGFDLAASEARPQPARVNITRVLVDGKDFNAATSMLEASGVVEEFEEDENGTRITIFIPTDEAFG